MSQDILMCSFLLQGGPQIQVKTKMPKSEIDREVEGDSEGVHPGWITLIALSDVDEIVHVRIARHLLITYTISPFTVRKVVPANSSPKLM